MRRKNSKNEFWNDIVKATVERKEASWTDVLRVRDEVAQRKIYGSL